MVNVRTVNNALKLNENVMQNYFSICIYSSAATLKSCDKNIVKRTEDVISKNSDRACPVAAVACFDRHVTKSRSLNFSPCLTDLIAQKSGAIST